MKSYNKGFMAMNTVTTHKPKTRFGAAILAFSLLVPGIRANDGLEQKTKMDLAKGFVKNHGPFIFAGFIDLCAEMGGILYGSYLQNSPPYIPFTPIPTPTPTSDPFNDYDPQLVSVYEELGRDITIGSVIIGSIGIGGIVACLLRSRFMRLARVESQNSQDLDLTNETTSLLPKVQHTFGTKELLYCLMVSSQCTGINMIGGSVIVMGSSDKDGAGYLLQEVGAALTIFPYLLVVPYRLFSGVRRLCVGGEDSNDNDEDRGKLKQWNSSDDEEDRRTLDLDLQDDRSTLGPDSVPNSLHSSNGHFLLYFDGGKGEN